MDIFTVAIIVLVLLFVQGIGLYVILRRREDASATPTDGLILLQKQMEELRSSLDSRMSESSRQMHETMRSQLGESSRLIKEITQEITSVKEIGRETGKFAEQLKSLQDILKNPKQRGVLGEYYLETVLKNVLPERGNRGCGGVRERKDRADRLKILARELQPAYSSPGRRETSI
jgi:DNA recombination protein RmuC